MRALWTLLGIGAIASVGIGCGSNQCADTATCAVPGDAAGGDVVGPDVTVEGGGGESGSGSGGDSGTDVDSSHPPGDSGTGSDSMTLPDVVFIDAASCPTGSVCIDPVPSGWSGPLILSDQTGGPPTPAPPACPSSYSNDAFDGNLSPTSPSAVCSCSCGALTGDFCATSTVGMVFYQTPTCSTGSDCGNVGLPYNAGGFCVGSGCASGPHGAIATEPPVQGGSCPPSGMSMNPASVWAETARACQPGAVGGGCSGSQVCVPSPPSPFSAKLCVLHSGNVSCPAGSYSQGKVFYASSLDSRSCAPACTCTAPTNLTCIGGAASTYDQNNGGTCGGNIVSVPVDGLCHPLSGLGGTVFAQATASPVPPAGGSCTASNPVAVGSVTQSAPTTLCCQP